MPSCSCPAKINLALSVGAPRPADGYHPLCSWMVKVSLADELTLERIEGASSFAIEAAADAPWTGPIDWPLERDLAVRAHHALESRCGRRLPVRAVLRKRIPAGAGLGGGSSDAAAMLAELDRLFGLGTEAAVLHRLAGTLGSDVPFFLGSGAAVVGGVGEAVEALPPAPALHLALLLPALRCDTAAVYRAYDELGPRRLPDESAVRRLAASRPLAPAAPFNDLTPAVVRVEPRLASLRESCARLLGRPVHVTGSGAAMFVVAEERDDARQIAETIRAAGTTALAVTTL